MVYVTHIRLTGGEDHQHISEVQWRNPADGAVGTTTRQGMVDWIRQGGQAWVANGTGVVEVRVVEGSPAYIRTVADGTWTNNLLALPKF